MKQDRKQVSKQPWEPKYVADKFDIPVEIVLRIKTLLHTTSRKRIEDGVKVYKEFS